MNRAGGTCPQHGSIDFFHERDGTRRLGANDHAVGMEKILDSGALAQEFRIGHDIEFEPMRVVNRKMLPKTLGGLNWYGALLNDQPIAVSAAHDQPGDGLDGAEIGLSVLERRSSDTDKDGLAVVNCHCGSRKFEPAGSDVTLHKIIQMRLEERHSAGLQAIYPLHVAIGAKHMMADFCQARRCG